MSPDTEFVLEIAGVVVIAALIVVIVAGAGAVHDAESALGTATLVTYEQAVAWKKKGNASERKEEDCCAICLSEYNRGDELVPTCGHFFHAECGVDKWLRDRRTCPLCRGGLCPLPECPPMPQRAGMASPH
ncbi:hypothetical protein PR202_gb11590 [Eleusine coracana subsp. coracana]|uniref:RING-type domain-containing protein n=1 Tax=Eleusine coracana subsp. coracana TaxID=191504 RepID=A0AAV5EMA4_ELECO|nr:hypothetical protein QOZ80_3BG0268870 [Eleusine coracana subsp. coracana]GJN23898.1 hypothetical protein PR202_gb11590 [Eleusine coracana subsp. coracana]